MKRRMIALIAIIAVTLIACVQKTDDWESTKIQAAASINAGDCASAWNLVWPWAKRGNIEARAILATGMVAAGLVPPGNHGDAITRFRHTVILAVHGAADGDLATIELLRALIRTELVSDMGGDRLKRCLDADKPLQVCVASAVNEGFVPGFEAYALEVDAIASIAGSPAASCSLRKEARELPLPKLK